MHKNNVAVAQAYYTAMGEKNIAGLEKYVHPNVKFVSPFAQLEGKDALLGAVERFASLFTTLTIRTVFGSGEHAAVAYDVHFPAPIGSVRTAALLTFQDGLVIAVELFFDARPF